MKLWLDTDIGVDPDDIFALYLLLGAERVDLKWLSVTFQNIDAKLAIVERIFGGLGVADIELLSGYTPKKNQGQTSGFLDEKALLRSCEITQVDHGDFGEAVRPWVEPRQYELCTIAPMTTAARVAEKFRPRRIVSMAANQKANPDDKEYNARSDVEAFNRLVKLGVPHYCLSREEYQKCPFGLAELREAVSGSVIGKMLVSSVENYQDFVHRRFGLPLEEVWLADVVTVMYLLSPEHFGLRKGSFEAADDGVSWFNPDDKMEGGALIIEEPEKLVQEVLERLSGGERE